MERTPAELVGHWRVRRIAGWVPGRGLTKRIDPDGNGVTRVLGLPLFPFRVVAGADGKGLALRYRLLPIRDELVPELSGWSGRGLLFNREFCRFRLTAADAWLAGSPLPHL
jgi:hypothetical protein